VITARFEPLSLADAWSAALDRLTELDAVRRLWDGDHTVIQQDPGECANRLGWLRAPEVAASEWPRWALAADEIVDGAGDAEAGSIDHVLVLGMGGSSLFPEVLARTFESGEGFPTLLILDSTDPDAVARMLEQCDPEHTVVVVASKSGSTIETRSHLELFWQRHPIGRRFVAITDPGSGLEALARDRGFRDVFHGDPEIGGRFSALSAFGLVPAALMGLDATALLETAAEAMELLGPETPVEHHVGCQLGALMAVAAAAGRDKLTFHLDDRLAPLGAWLEQLIAESTGKHGVGILPVLGEGADAPDPDGRLHVVIGDAAVDPTTLAGPWVHLAVEEPDDLGAQVYLWEWATTIAGIVLGINPFDQPDVESAKVAARSVLEQDADPPPSGTVDEALALLRPGDALVIGAFADPALEPQLQGARAALARRAGVASTLGMGPRFLHSTGQLHKGGADRIVVLQVLVAPAQDLAIPGESFTFGRLERAQADGDLAALQAAGKRAVRVELMDLLQG
jgi:glucose-6-phosphate isomerase